MEKERRRKKISVSEKLTALQIAQTMGGFDVMTMANNERFWTLGRIRGISTTRGIPEILILPTGISVKDVRLNWLPAQICATGRRFSDDHGTGVRNGIQCHQPGADRQFRQPRAIAVHDADGTDTAYGYRLHYPRTIGLLGVHAAHTRRQHDATNGHNRKWQHHAATADPIDMVGRRIPCLCCPDCTTTHAESESAAIAISDLLTMDTANREILI